MAIWGGRAGGRLVQGSGGMGDGGWSGGGDMGGGTKAGDGEAIVVALEVTPGWNAGGRLSMATWHRWRSSRSWVPNRPVRHGNGSGGGMGQGPMRQGEAAGAGCHELEHHRGVRSLGQPVVDL